MRAATSDELDPPRQVRAAQTWKSVLAGTAHRFGDNRATLIAAGVTYFLLLALFPTLTALVSIYGLFADATTISKNLTLLSTVIPAGGLQIINDQLARLTAQGAPTLGFALVVSLAIATWSASSGVKALFDAMNIAYEVKETRNFLVLNGVAIAFTLAGVIFAIVMLAVVIAMPVAFSFIGFGKGLEWLLQAAGYVVLALFTLLALAALYRFGPNRPDAKWRWISPGAILALVLIGAVSGLFSWYASNFAHFDKTYGSLGALIGFLFWMWVCNTAVIGGAELNAGLDRQTEKAPAAQRTESHPVPGGATSVASHQAGNTERATRRPAPPVLVISVILFSLFARPRAARQAR